MISKMFGFAVIAHRGSGSAPALADGARSGVSNDVVIATKKVAKCKEIFTTGSPWRGRDRDGKGATMLAAARTQFVDQRGCGK